MGSSKNNSFVLIGIVCVGLYALAGLLITPIENMTNAKISLTVFSIIVSFTTAMMVFVNEQRSKRKCIFGANRNIFVKTSKEHALIFSLIILVASITFFCIGFKYRMWYTAWIIFLIAGIVIEILKRSVFEDEN